MQTLRPATRRRPRRLLAVLVSLAILALTEGGLRVFGFGQAYPLFVPVPEAPGYLRANPDVVRRFLLDQRRAPDLSIRPVSFEREKGPDTIRVFVQGGSTAAGYPYGYGASPAGMLQQRLQRTFPEKRVEVVTTAVSAVNSYTLLDFSREILQYEPDAVVVYAGHNEYVGILGVGCGLSARLPRPAVLAFLWLRDLRLFQLVQRAVDALRDEVPDRSNRTLMATIVRDKSIPLDTPLYRRGLEQYRANMGAMLRRYRRARVPVFVGTLVSNERDQPPFVAGPSPGADVAAWVRRYEAGRSALDSGDPQTALLELEAAVAIDDAQAEAHYARGRALDLLGRYEEARRAYLSAKDRDELRFRATEELNRVVRDLAAEHGAHVVEVQGAFLSASAEGIVGEELMLEHLHPNLRGYFVLADAFYQAMHASEAFGAWSNHVPADEAWEEIPVTAVDRLYGEYRIGRLTSDWPFTSRKVPFRTERPAGPVGRIARDFYRGRVEWPCAMDELLEHYCTAGDAREAARVGVLLAEAHPHDLERQIRAAELAARAGRPEAVVYLDRAREAAGTTAGARLGELEARIRASTPEARPRPRSAQDSAPGGTSGPRCP